MVMKARLRTDKLWVSYNDHTVLKGIDAAIPDGHFTAIIGANGCGKSSLLKSIINLIRPAAGSVTLDGCSITNMRPSELARNVAMLPQAPIAPEGITVAELVARGRFAWQSFFPRYSLKDHEAVATALSATRLEGLADKLLSELSGGQRQRAWIAMVLAQDTQIILLDEPTSFLDLSHQVELMQLLVRLRKQGKTIVAVLHDINQACRYADNLIALADGRVIAAGSPGEILSPALVEEAFGLKVMVASDPVSGTPMAVAL